MATPEYFARVAGSVNFPLLQTKVVVILGTGMVGSQIARECARCGVGHLRFIDHDRLERVNLCRHALDDEYLEWNKAEGLAVYLDEQVEGLYAEAIPRKVDASVSDRLLDNWLADADLIIAATDDRAAQRRVGRRALAVGIPAVFPALYVEGGGEVIVQLDEQLPCFSCWDEFRPNDAPLRGAQALNTAAFPVIYTALQISLGLLDPDSPDREIMRAGGSPPYQVFGLNRFGTLNSGHLMWRRECPVCRGRSATAAQAEPWPLVTRTGALSTMQILEPRIHPSERSAAPRPRDNRNRDQYDPDRDMVVASGFCVALWYFVFAEGISGFALWYNPVALIAVIGWLIYAAITLRRG